VIGCDAAITFGGLGGYFELNLMMPLITHNILNAIALLANATEVFADRCIIGLEADVDRCSETVERNLALATALAPALGYDKAAEIAKEAQSTGKTVREIAEAWNVLPAEMLAVLLNPYRMTEPDGE